MTDCQKIKTAYENLIAEQNKMRELVDDRVRNKKKFPYQKVWEEMNLALHEVDLFLLAKESRGKRRFWDPNGYPSRLIKRLESEVCEIIHFEPEGAFFGEFRCPNWFFNNEEQQAKELAAMISHPRNPITALDLDKGFPVWSSAEFFKAFSSPFNRLEKLSIHSGYLPDEIIDAISATLLQPTCHLVDLDLSGNEIVDYGAKKLAETLLLPGCRLKKLCLDGNKISDVGAQLILDTLRNPDCKIEYIKLRNNSELSYDMREALRQTGRVYVSEDLD